jgi:tRNA modification GTPase
MIKEDTIAAIATARGEGAIAVVRLSGDESLIVAKRIFVLKKSKNNMNRKNKIIQRALNYGRIKNPEDGREIDEGFLIYMKSPASYTGEDTVELQCHGGQLVVESVLRAVLVAGARLAEPGEFTKRAFLNGKMDLAEAEAVGDLIKATSELALTHARARLSGALSKRVRALREEFLDIVSSLEVELDFTEEEIDGITDDNLKRIITKLNGSVEELLASYEHGRILNEGVKTVILGRPNVGKSSLLNKLLMEERAIVTEEPGTTRDVIEEVISINGLAVRLMDTAGLRKTTCKVESIGVERARERAESADLILYVVDVSDSVNALNIVDAQDEFKEVLKTNAKRIIVVNKIDLLKDDKEERQKDILKMFSPEKVVFISAVNEEGIRELEEAIFSESLGGEQAGVKPGELIVKVRHRIALEECLKTLKECETIIEEKKPRELLATELRMSMDRLSEIIGEVRCDEILEKIFSDFCIGK